MPSPNPPLRTTDSPDSILELGLTLGWEQSTSSISRTLSWIWGRGPGRLTFPPSLHVLIYKNLPEVAPASLPQGNSPLPDALTSTSPNTHTLQPPTCALQCRHTQPAQSHPAPSQSRVAGMVLAMPPGSPQHSSHVLAGLPWDHLKSHV